MKVIAKSRFQDIFIWALGSSIFGQPKMEVYSYLVDGVLIDSGQPNIKKKFIKSLRNEKIDKCILTHHHEDHSGNAADLKKLGVEIYGSPKCAEILKSPPRVSPIQYLSWGQNKKVDIIPLDLSQKIETEKYSFEIIETPGHAVDMISLYEPNQGWLFSADNFINKYSNIMMDNEKIADQILSLQKILKLDFDVLLCSHFPQFRNGKYYIQFKLDYLQDFYGKVKIEHEKGKKPNEIMKILGLDEFDYVKITSLGKLSQYNMVKSVVDSLES